MVKEIGYRIFAFVYYICRLFTVNNLAGNKRFFCVMTHDDGESSNVSLVISRLKKTEPGYKFSYITKTEVGSVRGFKNVRNLLSFLLIKPYLLAKSNIILLDNVFLPMAYIKVKKNVKVVQLWHGTGTIKKFGQDVNTGKLKELEKKANRNITHLIVNNTSTAKLYAKVFGISIDKVYATGLPKTDDILYRLWKSDKEGINIDKEVIYKKYKLSRDKKLILYAPTFRDENLGSETIINQVEKLSRLLPKDYILGLRLHPFVARLADTKDIKKICNLSREKDLSSLIMASDILISDYSSIIFEYCITEKPMIFFAYDLEEFSNKGRGFYEDYISYVPGPVAKSCEELIDIINKKGYSIERIRKFNKENFPNLDGKATKRIVDLIKS
jgi:CDP-ribitol ribitolphosphotransferase